MIETKTSNLNYNKTLKSINGNLSIDSNNIYPINKYILKSNNSKWLSIVSWGYPIAAMMILINPVKLGLIAGYLLLAISLVSLVLVIRGFIELQTLDDKNIRKSKKLKLLLSLLLGIIGIIASIGILFL